MNVILFKGVFLIALIFLILVSSCEITDNQKYHPTLILNEHSDKYTASTIYCEDCSTHLWKNDSLIFQFGILKKDKFKKEREYIGIYEIESGGKWSIYKDSLIIGNATHVKACKLDDSNYQICDSLQMGKNVIEL